MTGVKRVEVYTAINETVYHASAGCRMLIGRVIVVKMIVPARTRLRPCPICTGAKTTAEVVPNAET